MFMWEKWVMVMKCSNMTELLHNITHVIVDSYMVHIGPLVKAECSSHQAVLEGLSSSLLLAKIPLDSH